MNQILGEALLDSQSFPGFSSAFLCHCRRSVVQPFYLVLLLSTSIFISLSLPFLLLLASPISFSLSLST